LSFSSPEKDTAIPACTAPKSGDSRGAVLAGIADGFGFTYIIYKWQK
jgi:hypothetical protein